MNKLQEFQMLMSDLSTTAKVSVDAWSMRYALRRGSPEHVVVKISFTIPGKKTLQCLDKDQLVRLLRDRYNVAETDPMIVAILQRMDNEKATAVAETVAEVEAEKAQQAESRRVREQFPEHISEYELMQEVLRLRAGEQNTTDATLIAELRLQVERFDTENDKLRDEIDDLNDRVCAAERGEIDAQTVTARALEQLEALRSQVTLPDVVDEPTDDEVEDIIASVTGA